MNFQGVFQALRVLGFGSALGAGLGGWCFILWPNKLPGIKSMNDAMFAGALIGGGLCQVIERLLVGWLVKPITRRIKFYVKLLEIYSLGTVITRDLRKELVNKAVKDYFAEK